MVDLEGRARFIIMLQVKYDEQSKYQRILVRALLPLSGVLAFQITSESGDAPSGGCSKVVIDGGEH